MTWFLTIETEIISNCRSLRRLLSLLIHRARICLVLVVVATEMLLQRLLCFPPFNLLADKLLHVPHSKGILLSRRQVFLLFRRSSFGYQSYTLRFFSRCTFSLLCLIVDSSQ